MPRGGETLPSDVVTVEVTGPPFIPAEAEVGTIALSLCLLILEFSNFDIDVTLILIFTIFAST